MKSFPFDSHVTYDSSGVPSYDRAISSEPYRKLIHELFKTGIMPTLSTNMQVVAGDNMTVKVLAGFAVVEGCMTLEEETRSLEITASDTLDRIDTVVLRLNLNDEYRTCDYYVVAGTPANSPVHPALTRTNSIYEIGLADVFIPANTSAIADERITDTRYDTTRCGVISSISEFDTSTLNAQMNAWSIEQQKMFATWSNEQKDAFKAWLDSMKDILDEDTAGHLQTEIEALQTKIDGLELTAEKVSYDDTSTSLGSTTVQGAIEALKKFVSDGKSAIASAITKKGVSTSADATFDAMVTNIANIPNANSGTYTPTSRSASLDMGVANTYRYVNTNNVPNTNSTTYTPTSNGSALDMGATNTYRYVNTNTVYNSGYSDGKAKFVQSLTCSNTYAFNSHGAVPSTQTINVKSKYPSIYNKLSSSNFIYVTTTGREAHSDFRNASWAAGGYGFYYTASISYNSSTGVLSVRPPYISVGTQDGNSGTSYNWSNNGIPGNVYIIL